MIAWRTPSLRQRLVAGAGGLGGLAILAAFLAAYGVRQALWLGEEAAAAQRRMDALAGLSARITEMILTPADLRGSRTGPVLSAFATLDDLVAQDVARVAGADALGRAAQGQTLARMRAAFDRMVQDMAGAQGVDSVLRDAMLSSFAQVFTPLVREQGEYNRMRRETALAALDTLQKRMMGLALGMAVLVLSLMGLLYVVVLRPLLSRLRLAGAALAQAGGDGLPPRLPTAPRDELALLFARLNQLAARLDRRRQTVAADRARLESTVATRTAALAEANARLSRIDEDRRRFFADVSHELRTPLTVILAEAELAASARPPELSSVVIPALATIRVRAIRLNRRIEDLLRIARSDSGQLELDPRPTTLAEAVETALDDLRPLLHRAGLRVERRMDGPAPVLADPDWLRQIVGGI
ncbi:MAG: sensor histidine kinase, partial [Paracoccaceae bacterium]